jgi:hypothetical protein
LDMFILFVTQINLHLWLFLSVCLSLQCDMWTEF